MRAATADGGTSTLVLELPQSVEARSVIEAIEEAHPETELLARRETTSTQSVGRLDTRLEDLLTDKQFEALQAAHYSGFFEWPRETTGENIADALEISPPTYHYHLRAAERTLVSLVFDADTK